MISRVLFRGRRECRAYIDKHEAECLSMAGNLNAVGFHYDFRHLRSARYYVHRSENGETDGVMSFANDGNMTVFSASCEALDAFSEEIPCWNFHTLWCCGMSQGEASLLMSNMGWAPSFTLYPHYLMTQTEPACVPNTLEIINIRTHIREPWAETFTQRILKECFGYSTPASVIAQRTGERLPEEPYLVGLVRGVPVCQCHIQSRGTRFSCIGGVATLPEYRGRGYAAMITSEIVKRIRADGHVPVLTASCDNPTAVRLYERLGFTVTAPVWVYTDPD